MYPRPPWQQPRPQQLPWNWNPWQSPQWGQQQGYYNYWQQPGYGGGGGMYDQQPYRPYPQPYGRGVTAVAKMRAQESGNADGTIEFYQSGSYSDVTVRGRVTGLPGGQGPKGLHILAANVCPQTKDLEHFNPFNTQHGARTASVRHVGDLGNINVIFDGTSTFQFVDNRISLTGDNSIVNRTIVITEHEDDLGTKGDDGSKRNG